jgi:hypothetical protein
VPFTTTPPQLFRVFLYHAKSEADEPGGALYVPSQGGGRIDNPTAYSALYLSDSAAGAVAEAFGRFPEWTLSMLEGIPGLPRSVRALARYRYDDSDNAAPVCNLDDPKQLLALGLRPSDVVSRDYIRTRAWARRIYDEKSWAGVRWWSYYEPAWSSFGLWDIRDLVVAQVTPLRLDNQALVEASRAIVRRIVSHK